jgi:hypothetical protein
MAIKLKQQQQNTNSGSTTTTVSNTTYNPTQQPGTSAGNFEIKRFLYDSGLQNIFNDYQANVASLDQKEQQDLQDAYYVREMSKKYLGEYASNLGIGDVSGNLLDIYGKYQENLATIRKEYNNLELGLQSSYQEAQTKAFDAMMNAQYQRGMEELDENARDIIFNITSGALPQGMDQWDYISSELAAGRLTEESYQQIYGTLYSQGMGVITQTIQTGVQTGNFGTNDNGEVIDNVYDYIAYAEDKYRLTDADAKLILDQVNARGSQLEEGGFEITIYNDQVLGGESYINIDPTTYSSEAGANSLLFAINGIDYVSVKKDVNSDSEQDLPDSVSSADLNAYFYEQNPDGFAGYGTVLFYKDTNSFYVVGKDGKWYRAITTTGPATLQRAAQNETSGNNTWFIPKGSTGSSANGLLNDNGNDRDSVSIGGITYKAYDNGTSLGDSGLTTFSQTLTIKNRSGKDVLVKDIMDSALTIFGKSDYGALFAFSETFVVYHQGHVYQVWKHDGKIKIRNMKAS